jgi:hypothetical protein
VKRSFFVLAILLIATSAPAQRPPPLIFPEVHSDNGVTFRFRGPNVNEVALSLESVPKPFSLEKVDHDAWSVTTTPLAADLYFYRIVAHGVSMLIPLISPQYPTSSTVSRPGDFV